MVAFQCDSVRAGMLMQLVGLRAPPSHPCIGGGRREGRCCEEAVATEDKIGKVKHHADFNQKSFWPTTTLIVLASSHMITKSQHLVNASCCIP